MLDDFGTGYSSLSYLHRFPVDSLKIDRSLIADLRPEKSSQTLAGCIVNMAKSLGLATIAEGLENEAQYRIGKELNFEFVQGFYFARPQMAEEIPKLIIGPVRVSPQQQEESRPV